MLLLSSYMLIVLVAESSNNACGWSLFKVILIFFGNANTLSYEVTISDVICKWVFEFILNELWFVLVQFFPDANGSGNRHFHREKYRRDCADRKKEREKERYVCECFWTVRQGCASSFSYVLHIDIFTLLNKILSFFAFYSALWFQLGAFSPIVVVYDT